MNYKLIIKLLVLTTPLLVDLAVATTSETTNLMIVGRKESTVLSQVITLGDIADISSAKLADDDKIINLRKVRVQNSPNPGESITLSAIRVLEIIERSGVRRNEIGYSFPRVMTVSRASRLLSAEEVQDAINNVLADTKKEASVKNLFFDKEIRVAPGMSRIKAVPLNSLKSRHIFSITASVEGEEDIRFTVPAEIEEWITVPVASRGMSKGEIVKSEDLVMARLNLAAMPLDATINEKNIIGYEVGNTISPGESFRKKSLKIPPVVIQGSKITLLYTKGILNVTASGTCLEDGIEGQLIKVQNDASKRVLMAHVVERGLVKIEAN
ncbi:MAG: flagellar basal body P-ring formation chaperone FlgA [bacterium]|nr:flagellar basal body P-ring formation chaperone FlgA [bacterium]